MSYTIENVLEIEIKKIDDNYSYAKVIYQNYDILKRGEFEDNDIGVYSREFFEIVGKCGLLFINGTKVSHDNVPVIIKNELTTIIKERIEAINHKYGIKRRWRAKVKGIYYFINEYGYVITAKEDGFRADDDRYRVGNYFQSIKEAKNFKIYKAFKEMCENEEK